LINRKEKEMKAAYIIKNPTVRKVKNRGFKPVWYFGKHGWSAGWVFKEGTKWLYFYSPTVGKKRLPKTTRLDPIK
tara:strand:- start:1458 stop:1682 length:225 start_codon:yes stop_codon:yes gene_type:complete